MDIRLIAIIILALLSAILYTFFQKNLENLSDLKYSPDTRLRFYTNAIYQGKSPSFGWVTNNTLIYMHYMTASKICDMKTPTYILPGIFSQIKQHQLYLNDPNIAVAQAIDGGKGIYLLVNNTKWVFSGNNLTNATYNYGVDEDKVIYAKQAFLNNYPTTYVLDWN